MRKNALLTSGIILLCLSACNNDFIDLKDDRHMRVYQDDKAVACNNAGITVKAHGKLLIDENIELHCSQKGNDGMSYTESCGSNTGSINIFTIHAKDLYKAESLGFSQLAALPDAQLDKQCEFKVISDVRKYGLINQLNDEYDRWQSNKTTTYAFQFHLNYADCPTFAPTPTVKITVSNNVIDTVYDIGNEVFLTNLDSYMTIDEIFDEFKLQLELTPIEAGLSSSEPKAAPKFSTVGVPEHYFYDAGSNTCDAANYTLSNVELMP